MIQQIIHGLDLFGVAVFAVSGALAAGRKRMDIFGVIVLGVVTAIGGGTLRDVLLDEDAVFWFNDRIYLWIAAGAAIVTFIVGRQITLTNRWLLLFDALGLAVFTFIGAEKTLIATGSETLAVVMGIMTGVAGGMIRDVLSAEVPLVLQREVYAVAAFCGALIYVAMQWLAFPPSANIVVSISATFLIRMAAIRYHLSLPSLHIEDVIESDSTPEKGEKDG